MPELVIGGILLVPVIVGLVEFAKSLGLPSQYAPLLNAVLSAIAYIGISLFGWADLELTALVVNVIIIFLTAAGFYTTSKFIARAARGG